jgi:hypothetical protein
MLHVLIFPKLRNFDTILRLLPDAFSGIMRFYLNIGFSRVRNFSRNSKNLLAFEALPVYILHVVEV